MTLLGKDLRRARVEQGFTQAALAVKVNVSQATVCGWEADRSRPKPNQLRQLRTLLNLAEPTAKNSADNQLSDGSRAFGRWLERARTDAGLSVPELAELANVSMPAIYNIEAGRSTNPRTKTRRKLERALKQVTPEEVVEVSEEANSIEGLGPLTDFDPHDKEDRPKGPGVYVFYDVSDRPIYVGKASNIGRRVREHEEKFWFKAPIVSNGAYVEIPDDKLRDQVEQVMIRFLKSNAVINKQLVER